MAVFSSTSYMKYFRALMVCVLGIAAICLVFMTYRWPLVGDAQVLHYINFLIDKGFAPYRDITDMNMPGAYMIEGWAMHIFGGGDMAWRMYDFVLLALLGVAMVVIAMPYDWIAGAFASVMFGLVHVSEGALDAAQRDEEMIVLIMIGYALVFEALRRKKPWMMVLFGLSLGMASSVKPTVAPLGFVLLAMAWWSLRKRGEATASYIWGGLAGACIAAAINFGFLFHYGSTGAFFEINRRLTPYYAGLNHPSFAHMLRKSLPRVVLLMLPFGLLVSFVDRQWKNWERWALLLGVALGGFSYFAQHKGYAHHRYGLVAFMLLWMAIELMLAMRRQGWVRAVGVAGMALGTLVMVPTYVHRILLVHPVNVYTESLERDLTRLGGDQLQGKVQCLDLVDGCLTALYHLKLVQSTGSTGDLLLFPTAPTPAQEYYQELFWEQINRNPPSIFVLSNEWWPDIRDYPNFDKVNKWPEFAAYLSENYNMALSKEFLAEQNHGYRIYVRKGAALPSIGEGN
jgi:hypothetical protein